MSRIDLRQQKTIVHMPKESFQSIDDYYLQTEEDEITQGPRIKSRTNQIGDQESTKIHKPPPIIMGGAFKKQNESHKLLFSKPKYLAKSIEQPIQDSTQIGQGEKNVQIDRPITPKIIKKTTNNLSINQFRPDFMPSIKEAEDDKHQKKQQTLEFFSNKAIPPRTLLSINSKYDPQASGINIADIQRRMTTNKSETNSKSVTSLKENIFAKDSKQEGMIDIKTNQLFGQGPRYDGEGNIVQYSLVGRPEWFMSAQEDQKTHKRDSGKQSRLNKKISMASFASKTSSVRIKNSIDTLSRIDKKKKTQKIFGEELSKEQLLRKIENFEQRIEENKKIEEKDVYKKRYYEKVNEEKQMHQLAQFEQTNEKWEKLNLNISEKILRPPENTLLKSSIPQFRQKVEITSMLEQVKNPNEILGEKFWEVTLRDKFIDYTKIQQGQGDSNQDDFPTTFKDGESLDRRAHSSHQINRSFYRELSYSKGTRVPVIFKKDVEVIKHPKLPNSSMQGTLQYQTLGQFFGTDRIQASTNLANTLNSQQPRPLISQQMSRRPYSQQSMSNISYRAKTPFNYTGFANANEFMNSIQHSTQNNQLNSSLLQRGNLNNSFDKVSQFFTAITADPDELVIKGENKLKSEKEAIMHDGNHNQFRYKHFSQDEIQQLERLKDNQASKQEELKHGENTNNSSVRHSDSIKRQNIAGNAQNSGVIQKQSTFGHQKKSSNVSDVQFNMGESSTFKKRGDNNSSQFQLQQMKSIDSQNYQSLNQQKSLKDPHAQSFQLSIKKGAFNQPFQMV